MSLQTYIRVFVAALYNETAVLGFTRFQVGAIVRAYGLDWKIIWADNFISEIRTHNFARVYWVDGPPLEQYVSIGAAGVLWVENSLRENLASFLKNHGAVYHGEIPEVVKGSIDSALWTGLRSNKVVALEKRDELVRLLVKAERDLDALSGTNSEKGMARAYIVAARVLAEAPEPPEDLIWELVGRANSLAGVASLFVSIIALFATVSR